MSDPLHCWLTTVFFVHEFLLVPTGLGNETHLVPLYYRRMTVFFGHEVLLVPRPSLLLI